MNIPTIDFMGKRVIAAVFSVILVVGAISLLATRGLNWGLDFTGGTLVEVAFTQPVLPEEVRQHLEAEGFENGVVQTFGSEIDLLIRMPVQVGIGQEKMGDEILTSLEDAYPGVVMRQSNFVGPAVGQELTESGGIAMLVALAVVMIYILFRFTGKFSVGAVVALAHDVIIVVGAFSLLQLTFDLPVLAAVLAVIGYSLNDTIVVSDRIRENFRLLRRGSAVDTINTSLNQTLGRTLVTSFTTLLVLGALLVVGGELIRGFSIALSIGVLVGTYSSIFVAASTLVVMNISREDLLVPEKEGADTDSTP